MLRVTFAAAAAAFFLLTASASAAPPPWFDEGTAFITAANPQANCAPDASGTITCGFGPTGAGSSDQYVIYNGVAMWGSCGSFQGMSYGCSIRVSHDAVPGSTPQHGCVRDTNTMYGDKQRAWFWDIYQPPKPFETAELATLAECIAKTQGDRPPDVRRGRISFSKHGKRLALTGSAGYNGGTLVQRLSVTLPKGVSVKPKRTCSRTAAAALTFRELKRGRCSLLMAGLLDDPEHDFWFAIAGAKGKVWLRARGNGKLLGFGTGRLQRAKGGYGQTLVAELGQLGLNAELVGVQADGLHTSRPCRNGLRYRIELVSDAGTLKTSKKARCPGK